MQTRSAKFYELLSVMLLVCSASFTQAANLKASDDKTIRLFNGTNFDGWYVYTTETGHKNPGVF